MSSCFTWTGSELTPCMNLKNSVKTVKGKKKKKKDKFSSLCFGNDTFFSLIKLTIKSLFLLWV